MRYLTEIIGKLKNEFAENLTDEEIKRCFKFCVCEDLLIRLAKTYRDFNILTLEMICKE